MKGSFAAMASLAAAISAAWIGSATAAPVTETYNLILTGFVDTQGVVTTPPVSTIDLSATITFDPTLNYDDDTSDIKVNTLTGFTPASQIGFTYEASSHELFIGGTETDSGDVLIGTEDLLAGLDVTNLASPTFISCKTPFITCGDQSNNPAFDASGYATTTDPNSLFFIIAANGSVAVPEPPDAAPLVLPLLTLGWILRRRHARA